MRNNYLLQSCQKVSAEYAEILCRVKANNQNFIAFLIKSTIYFCKMEFILNSQVIPNKRTLLQALFPNVNQSLAKNAVIVIISSLALALSAKVQLPIGTVPFSMQTYVVLVLGALLGKRLATFAVLLYLAAGLAGLPVFTAGGGLRYLTSPTFGYLVGFLPSVIFIGYFTELGFGRTIFGSIVLMSIGHILIFVFGMIWLVPMFGLEKAYLVGIQPFFVMFAVKTILAALSIALAWKKV
jgi:biotin transport system substrate-specific component